MTATSGDQWPAATWRQDKNWREIPAAELIAYYDQRDKEIADRVAAGETMVSLAKVYDITPRRISQLYHREMKRRAALS